MRVNWLEDGAICKFNSELRILDIRNRVFRGLCGGVFLRAGEEDYLKVSYPRINSWACRN